MSGKTKIRYEHTKKSAHFSAAQLRKVVRKYGTSNFSEDYDDDGDLVGVRFTLKHDGKPFRVALRPPVEAICDILREGTGRSRGDVWHKAHRIAWRHLYYLTEQLLISAELGLKSVAQVFMADIEVPDPEDDRGYTTLGRLFEQRAGEVVARIAPPAIPESHRLPPARHNARRRALGIEG